MYAVYGIWVIGNILFLNFDYYFLNRAKESKKREAGLGDRRVKDLVAVFN
jgi:hypothetical protein